MKPKITCTLNGDWNLKEKNGDIKSVVDVPGSVFEALVINKSMIRFMEIMSK
jgi:hypothetical protein